MKLSLGIVGLPNVGKSTLFNALTNQKIPAENYPFCTIDPNVGVVEVHDERLTKIVEIEKPDNVVPAVVEFVDIAGIVSGAHEGEGLGNQFLSHIREVSAIVQVVRAFDDTNVVHVEGRVSPKDDIEIINTELILKDLDTIDSRIAKNERLSRNDKELKIMVDFLKELKDHLEKGSLAYTFNSGSEKIEIIKKELHLLTGKPFIYILNSDKELSKEEIGSLTGLDDGTIVLQMDIKTEYEISLLDAEEKEEYIKELNLKVTGLQELSKVAYDTLGLMSFFTAGKQEVRAWTIENDMVIKEAVGVIHNDFTKNFIAADVVSFKDYIEFNGWDGSKQSGKVRLEGKDYVVKDGDIIIVRHN